MKNAEQSLFPMNESVLKDMKGGLNKREYFAGLAMQGILANEDLRMKIIQDAKKPGWTARDLDMSIAMEAVLQADALLTALEKQK